MFSIDVIRTHTINTLLHESLILISSALGHYVMITIYLIYLQMSQLKVDFKIEKMQWENNRGIY